MWVGIVWLSDFCYDCFSYLISLFIVPTGPWSAPSRVGGCRKLGTMPRGNCMGRLSIKVALVGKERARGGASC